MNPKARTLVLGVLAFGIAMAVLGCYPTTHPSTSPATSAEAGATPSAEANRPPDPPATRPDFTAIVENYGPGVVNVSVERAIERTGFGPRIPGLRPDDPFFEFFRGFRIPAPRGQTPLHGLGSVFVVSSDGVILTNAHVLADASNVTVKLTDKREFKAKVIGIDKLTDLAVLKIDARNLPTVKIGKADDVRIGEWAVAIGSPYGFENSVTAGIVSAKSRALPDATYVPFIQTDVAVNPGNSGGPLFNMKGEVIGINSQIYSRSGGYQGLSFAIPINVALDVQDQLLRHGKVTRGWLGVTIQNVNQALADSFGLNKPAGALVSSVEKGSPAANAGLMPGDVILRFNDEEITSSSDLPALVAGSKPGTAATLEVMRKGTTKHLDLIIGELEDHNIASADVAEEDQARLGVVVRPLDPEEQKQAGVSNGLMVEDSTGPAARAGIRPGDIILSLNNTPVKSVEQLRALVSKAGKHVALLVLRDETRIFVPVNIG